MDRKVSNKDVPVGGRVLEVRAGLVGVLGVVKVNCAGGVAVVVVKDEVICCCFPGSLDCDI
jgi:hypothetical protein